MNKLTNKQQSESLADAIDQFIEEQKEEYHIVLAALGKCYARKFSQTVCTNDVGPVRAIVAAEVMCNDLFNEMIKDAAELASAIIEKKG